MLVIIALVSMELSPCLGMFSTGVLTPGVPVAAHAEAPTQNAEAGGGGGGGAEGAHGEQGAHGEPKKRGRAINWIPFVVPETPPSGDDDDDDDDEEGEDEEDDSSLKELLLHCNPHDKLWLKEFQKALGVRKQGATGTTHMFFCVKEGSGCKYRCRLVQDSVLGEWACEVHNTHFFIITFKCLHS